MLKDCFIYCRAFCDKGNKVRLDHFFALLFESTLGKSKATSKENPRDNLYDCLPGVRSLSLPTTTMVCKHVNHNLAWSAVIVLD
jgi:hypothetical protein